MCVLTGRDLNAPCQRPFTDTVGDGLAAYGRVAWFNEGETIFTSGQPAHACYRILSGCVEIRVPAAFESGEGFVCTDGEVFGEVAALSGARRSTAAVARERTACLVLTPTSFVECLAVRDDEAALYAASFVARMRRGGGSLFSRMIADGYGAQSDASALPLQEAVRLFYAVEDVLDVLESDRAEAVRFARTLVSTLRASARSAHCEAGHGRTGKAGALRGLRRVG